MFFPLLRMFIKYGEMTDRYKSLDFLCRSPKSPRPVKANWLAFALSYCCKYDNGSRSCTTHEPSTQNGELSSNYTCYVDVVLFIFLLNTYFYLKSSRSIHILCTSIFIMFCVTIGLAI